jgi:hypothetical protein
MTKYCPGCQRTLPVEAYARNASRWDNCQSWCKVCMRRYVRSRTARLRGEHYVEPRRPAWPPPPR